MCEELQDLEDYIQYQFDDIPPFKLALFLKSGEVRVKVALGEVEENLLESLVTNLHQFPSQFEAGGVEFKSVISGTVYDDILDYTTSSGSPRVFVAKNEDNVFIVYCCGAITQKDENRVRELMLNLMI